MARLRRSAPYLLALALVVLLLWQIDPATVMRLLLSADPGWILVGIAFYVLTNILRAFRFDVLLDLDALPYARVDSVAPPAEGDPYVTPSPPLALSSSPLRILPEMFALSLFNNVLPSRSGELSFPYFMRKRHGMAIGESTAALLVVRIFDYLAVALLYCILAWLNLSRLASGAARVVQIVGLALFLSMIVVAAMPWLGRQGMRFVRWATWRLGIAEIGFSQALLRVGDRIVSALATMRTPRTYGLTLVWSLLVWLATFAWFAAFMQAMGLGMHYSLVIVGATFAMLAKAIPFITVGGFGAHEAGWAVGFGLVGMGRDLAIASGFAVNILTLLASVVFGGLSLAYMRIADRKRTADSSRPMPPNDGNLDDDRWQLPAAQPSEAEV